jgi:hypothetical protein
MDEHDRIARPRIDPTTTPFWETEAFRRYGLTDDPDGDSPEALYTKAVIEEQGFDGPPHIVPRRVLDRYIVAGEVELLRGVSDVRHVEQLRHGAFFVGRGGFADGMYAVAGRSALVIARQYTGAGAGALARMSLKQGARVIDSMVLEERALAALTSIRLRATVERDIRNEALLSLYNDYGRYAAYLGYDAIRVEGFDDEVLYVVLNRTALRIQREDMR